MIFMIRNFTTSQSQVKNCFGNLFKFLISTMSNKKKVTFHCDMTNDEIFAILDSVQSDEENDVENLLNDSDTEFECITKDAQNFIMNAESSATQENVLEAVIHPETMAQNESDCDFVINNRNISSHTVSRQQKHNESSNSLKPIKEPKVCSGEKDILIRKSVRGKPKKSQVPPRERIRNNTFVEDLQWKSGGHKRMEVDDCIYPDDIRCKLSFDND